MNVLVVGAGAVGTVYGAALSRAGDDVTFWVREKYLDELKDGIPFHELSLMGGTKSATFVSFKTASKVEDIETPPDEIWLCVSKTAVKGDWVEMLADAFPDAQFISFQPGLNDFQDLQTRVPNRVKSGGVIGFVAYQPHNKNGVSGITVFYPPTSPSMIFGDAALSIVERLTTGGCPAKLEPDALKIAPQMSVILITFVLALERVDWSLNGFRKDKDVRGNWQKAAQQSLAAVCRDLDTKPIGARKLIDSPMTFGAALSIAPKVAPFDVETYLKFHFLKVRDQSIAMIAEYQKTAKKHDLPHDAIDELIEKVNG